MTSIEITDTDSEKNDKKTGGRQNLTRRRFLKAAGALTILVPGYLAGINDILAFTEADVRSQEILVDLTKSALKKYKNTSFWLRPEGSYSVELKLIEIDGDDDQFSVLFLSPQAEIFPQNTYWVEHAELGEFDLFLVPLREDRKGMYYVATFNHVIF